MLRTSHLIFLGLLAAGGAQAATVEIVLSPDPDGSGYSKSSIVFSGGGMTVTALGQVSMDGGITWETAPMASFGGHGLAILNPGDDTHQIDGSGFLERVLLTFDGSISLLGASFTYVTSDDQFAVWTFGPDTLVDGLDIPNLDNDRDSINSYMFSSGLSGSQFAIGALGLDDDFKLNSLFIDAESTSVPVPGTLGLLGLGLLGLGMLRRKQ